MALSLSVPIGNSGIAASYWRIADGRFDFSALAPAQSGEPSAVDGALTYTFVGYLDDAARIAGNDPVPGASHTRGITWAQAVGFITQAQGNLRAALYLAAKAQPFFSGAADA